MTISNEQHSRFRFSKTLALGALCIAMSTLWTACQPEEIVRNVTSTSWSVLVGTGNESTQVAEVLLPEAALKNGESNILSPGIGSPGTGSVTNAVQFLDQVFLFVPSAYRVDVLQRQADESWLQIDTMDFSAEQLVPSDICFPNATTGYLAFENTDYLLIVDRTTLGDPSIPNIYGDPVTVGYGVKDLAFSGNSVFCAVSGENMVAVLHTPTNQIKKTLAVHTHPLLLDFDVTNQGKLELLVVSAGAGKFDENEVSEARFATFDISTPDMPKEREFPLFLADSQRLTFKPRAIAVTSLQYAYVAGENNLLRIDTRDGVVEDNVRRVRQMNCTDLLWNASREVLLAADASRNSLLTFSRSGAFDEEFSLQVTDINTILLP